MVRLRRWEFEQLVIRALENIPVPIKSRMDNVDVVVREWPSPDDLAVANISDPHDLLGLYHGIPLTERSDYTMELPDVITIFHRPVEARCATKEAVVEEVRVTVVHEVAHHFGISDQTLDDTPYQ
ncbi:MAG: metallopeptidase family protein [Chloroflexi bacterium]|nr:metallopeptidase family protein [Chloroflexota bacterium]MCZ6788641.1 metallopeptidase family protein [Chloroflexota bacterium]MCZ6891804.1 metallopeptidase family protein [Chloroflexota bacterium]